MDRQQRSEADDWTMDGAALRSIVQEAARLGVRGLWCDAWCFRVPAGEAYDHAAFTAELTRVVTAAACVVPVSLARVEGGLFKMSSIKRSWDAARDGAKKPAYPEGQASVRVTLRAPAWSTLGYAPGVPGFV